MSFSQTTFPLFTKATATTPSLYPIWVRRIIEQIADGAFTYQDAILEVRDQLGDDVEGCYRYPDDMLIAILNRAFNELERVRPDAYFAVDVPEITTDNWTDTFAIEGQFFPAIIQYVVGMTMVSEDEYIGESGQAEAQLQLFETLVLSV